MDFKKRKIFIVKEGHNYAGQTGWWVHELVRDPGSFELTPLGVDIFYPFGTSSTRLKGGRKTREVPGI